MSGSISLVGKLFLGAAAMWGGAKLYESWAKKQPRQSLPTAEELALPQEVFDELTSHTFVGNKAAFLNALDSRGAPKDMVYRTGLWTLLGGQ